MSDYESRGIWYACPNLFPLFPHPTTQSRTGISLHQIVMLLSNSRPPKRCSGGQRDLMEKSRAHKDLTSSGGAAFPPAALPCPFESSSCCLNKSNKDPINFSYHIALVFTGFLLRAPQTVPTLKPWAVQTDGNPTLPHVPRWREPFVVDYLLDQSTERWTEKSLSAWFLASFF